MKLWMLLLYWIKKLMERKCTWILYYTLYNTRTILGRNMSQTPSSQHTFHCPTSLHLQKEKKRRNFKKNFKGFNFKKVIARALNPKHGAFCSWGPGYVHACEAGLGCNQLTRKWNQLLGLYGFVHSRALTPSYLFQRTRSMISLTLMVK